MKKKTIYFQNCLGVFQGGGCRASAYVGAYKKAVEWGVSFSEVVGTSAGAIIATFIAAGASPNQLEKYIGELDFLSLRNKPEKIKEVAKQKYESILRYIPSKTVKSYLPIYTSLGLYNSQGIKNWVNDKLSEITGKRAPIKFKDLIIETHVIVSDLKTKKVEIFNKENSSNMDVAEAVQYSCNIPIYFQPINLRYVDGGMLSNLATFVFSNKHDRYYNKILAFTLESNIVDNNISSFLDYGNSLISTIVDGGSDIQVNLIEDTHIIKIDTGNILATDFDKMTPTIIEELKNNGANAVEQFFKNELTNIKSNCKNPNILKDSFHTYNKITQLTEKKHEEIIIINNDNKFVYEIFPTLVKWINDETQVYYLYDSCESKDGVHHFDFRNRFLEHSGVNIIKLEKDIPFNGFILDGTSQEFCRAIILNNINAHFHSKFYEGETDYIAITLMRNEIKTYLSKSKKHKLIAEKIKEEELITALRSVNQYNNSLTKLALKNLEIETLIFITQFVRGYKYRQISVLYKMYENYNIELFDSAKLVLRNNQFTMITPPVIEKIGDKYFVIEGNTRLVYAYKNGIKNMNCVVVEGVEEPLPADGRFSIKEVILSDKEVIGENRYDKFDYKYFRKIESAVRNPTKCLL